MPKILVNYIYNKKTNKYALMDTGYVFADMPIAVMEIEAEYGEIMVVPLDGKNTVVDKQAFLSVHKQFRLVAKEDGSVEEHEQGTPIWLPKDTDVTRLRYLNGKIVMIEFEENGGQE
jgi:hypothetical protein